ncbi:MAG: branched-chain amino acid ABC transporter permease [Rhodospirillales bacterium]
MFEPIILAQILWTGIATAAPFVLLTVGFALTLKVTGLWNFAQSGQMAIAFYTMFYALNGLGLPLFAAVALGVVFTAGAAYLIEVCGLQVLRDRQSGNLTFFIFTLILSEFIIYVITLVFGTEPETLYRSILSPIDIVGGIAISDWDKTGIGMTAIGLIALYVFMRYSKEGQFLTAVADNARLAELYGISARRAYRVVAIVAALFIVAAMYLIGSHGGIVPNSPLELVLSAVIGTLLGGIGRVFAAAWASIFLALIQSFSILFIGSRWQNLLLYGFLFATIILFPRGVRMPRFRWAR